jgi:2-oxo-4-hydroxy-4-carboxy-5-ureidoimidazoline decarboxylase
MNIDSFNSIPIAQQKEELFKCCGSTSWVEKISLKFPFHSIEELKMESDKIWLSCNENDWKEAFSHHPKIGDIKSLAKKFSSTNQWASGEQAGVNEASLMVLREFKNLNDEYQNKFGYIFIVCATGKSAEEMLSILKERLQNSHSKEILIAMQEQNKITHLRLEKLIS